MVENKDLVSVIIPMYNAEKSIEKCVGSIIQQTYTNLEIIIVNDGSVDNSPYIVENFQKNDHRVKLINKKNEGASAARNTGLEYCTGDYIYFIDSDDYVDKEIIEVYLSAMKGKDMVIGRLYDVYEEQIIDRYHIEENVESMDDKAYLKRMAKGFNTTYFGGLVNKLYNAKIIREHCIRLFTDVSYREDQMFNICYLSYVKRVGIVSKPLYYYQRDIGESLSDNKRTEYKWIMFQKALNNFIQLCVEKGNYEECKEYINNAIAEQIIWPTQEIIAKYKRKEAIRKLKEVYTKENIEAIKSAKMVSYTIKIAKISIGMQSYTLMYILIKLMKRSGAERKG